MSLYYFPTKAISCCFSIFLLLNGFLFSILCFDTRVDGECCMEARLKGFACVASRRILCSDFYNVQFVFVINELK